MEITICSLCFESNNILILFRQNSLNRLTLLMLLTILVSHMEINPLSGKKTPSSNSSCKVRVLLNSKRGKIKVTKKKRVTILTKQMK